VFLCFEEVWEVSILEYNKTTTILGEQQLTVVYIERTKDDKIGWARRVDPFNPAIFSGLG